MPRISKHALIEPPAKLGSDVRVGAFSCIGPHVKIGPGCVIDSGVTITGRTTLGENNHVFPMTVIGANQTDTDGSGQVIIGHANTIREHVTISPGKERPTIIGDDNLIMIASRVGAGVTIGNHGIFANCNEFEPDSVIEDYVRTSAFVVVKAAMRVGAYTFMVGYTQVDRDAPPFAMVQGSPLRVRGVNTENLRRCGFDGEDIQALKSAFRDLFNGTDDRVDPELLRELIDNPQTNPHVHRLTRFLQHGIEGGPY